ncbi:MAG TPA: adenine deaminase [Candidatus Limnocylindrales bacterium]|nr:adenine deaminase [Candidatus Limnocylindrales bacterium]
MTLADRIAAARGDSQPDLVLKNATLINVLTGEIYPSDIVIHDGHIVALAPGYEAKETVDLGGNYVCPGFIDAHVHIESSLCTPPEFARMLAAHGVTSAITDPHEIANVYGADGIRYMLDKAEGAPINLFVMASSCVPATAMETNGAAVEAEDLAPLMSHPRVLGLAEMMNYPGVVYGDEGILDKLDLFAGKVMDGHSPSVTGRELQAYVAAGIMSDHECTTPEEAMEKLRLGLTLFIREGTTTRNLLPLLPVISDDTWPRICFCTDDRQPASLMDEGSIDFMVRTAIAHGIDPMTAIRIATINTANYFRLYDRGAVAPGRRADLVVFSSMNDLHADRVYRDGVLIAQDGECVAPFAQPKAFPVRPSMNVKPGIPDFRIPARGDQIRVIVASDDQVVTGHRIELAAVADGEAIVDLSRDLLKIATIERHRATGHIGLGFITGFGLKRGAIAGSVGHDHHNLIVIGADDASMAHVAQIVIDMGGGLAAVADDRVLGTLALPVAGLMTDAPMDEVRQRYDALIAAAQSLGSTMPDPFMTMSFMGLEVIPSLKLTDLGLVDVEAFKLVDLFV